MAGEDVPHGASAPQLADHASLDWRERAGWAAGWLAVVALALWTRRTTPGWLVLAAAGALLWTALAARGGRNWGLGAAAALWLATGIAAGVQVRLHRITHDWEVERFLVEERAEQALGRDLNALVDRGARAVDGAISAAGAAGRGPLFDRLAALRAETGVSALAIYGPDGAPVAWAGEHRGTVPDSVRRGARAYFFSASPLFGYLYFSRRLDGGRTAVAAVLLEANLSVGRADRPFAVTFATRHGITPRFFTPDRAQGESVWDWATDVPILSVAFARLTQEGWRERVAGRGRWGAGIAWGAAFVLLCAAWYRRRAGPPGVPVGAGALALLLAPLGEMTGAEGIFSPAGFVLPLPPDVTLGHLLVLLAAGAILLLTRTRPARRVGWGEVALRTGGAALAFPLAIALVRDATSPGMLAAHSAGGMSLVLAGAFLAALAVYPLLPTAPAGAERDLGARWWIPALLLSLALGVGVVLWWRPGRETAPWIAPLWSLPFLLFAVAAARTRLGRSALLPWLAAGWLGGTAAASHLWTAHLDARLEGAERELAQLGTAPDPYLDFLLRQFAEHSLRLASEGREGVGLLYQSWVMGGLAKEGYEARVTLWEGTRPTAELRLSDLQLPDSLVAPLLVRSTAAEEPLLERYTQQPSVHYLLLVPLPGSRAVTVAVPPRTHLGRSSALARLLDPGREPEAERRGTSLSLVPVAGTAPQQTPSARSEQPGGMRWLRTGAGWRSETVVRFPAGPMHAHLVVRTPSPLLLVVRSLLVLALALGIMGVLWTLARTLCGEPLGLESSDWRWARTFRGRLTLALFVFFLIPMALFGATAYQALSREVVRTAAALAQRSLEQAASEAHGQPLRELGEHVRADLLLYQNGVLTAAAPPEVVDLGLYNTWLPPRLFLDFATSEEVQQLQEQQLGGREYLIAYQRLSPRQVLAAPTPLASGEITRRQRELGNVVLLAVLLGAGLSVVLSLMVGRMLARPIDDLSRAAAAVGSGNLRVRLRESREDEFGGLYRSFNRMVRRLRQTRGALVRETRRTEAVVEEAGTGVLALDPAGRVALINARAEQILGTQVETGRLIPEDTAISAVVARAVREFRHSGAAELGDEVEVEGRIVRLRLRRLRHETGMGGAVVALEDITSEIRSARVLAWGEMARQVAHEIKNPLTPIKLSVQHIRRAYADGRPDFGTILDRNVEAILGEIDRLGEIARGFARFGAPAPDAGDLAVVDLRRVVEETLALYRGTEDGIGYRVEIDPATPQAYTRVGELKEVLVNLLENARAAIPDGGEIRFSTSAAGGGEWVMLDVVDTGEGISPDLLPRIFEPQFSTRSSGTGLGLAIVRRLVESWGGEVTVDSTPGQGTTVHLRMRAEDGDGTGSN